MADTKEPLLLSKDVSENEIDNKNKNKYECDEKCSGCQIERRKAEDPNIPWSNFVFIWVITLTSALPITFIFPFLYFMVRDFGIATQEEDVSFYAGFEGSAFMVGRVFTSVIWGMLADRYGRRPVMIFSTSAIVLFNIMFGLSANYWMALTSRMLLGAFCGAIGPMRAYATEVTRREHQALALSMMTSAWGIGLVIGPALGGYLAQPADKFPGLFSQQSIFGKFPYLLASLIIAIAALCVIPICFYLPETLHTCEQHAHGIIHDQAHDIEDAEKSKNTSRSSSSWFSLLRNWPLMSSIIVYCVFQLHDMAYTEIFSLWTVSPRDIGGLSFSTEDAGQALVVAGIGLLICQLLIYPTFERHFGPVLVARVGAVLSIALLSSYPFLTYLKGSILLIVTDLASALKNVLSISIATGLFLLQNRAVHQHQRGASNGISLSLISFFKALGPAAAGALLSWSQTRKNATFLPGSHIVFFVLNVIEFVGLLMTFKPFLAKPAQEFC
ncbi:protein ZINC INDUCED FACILITATOR-LIKE 1-like [Amaranthus tricolor]|uniref:protein ZINC INDUCED FACILITATOR-LIKE 1-like n=1 Tax=Amaranthus tricolor TaxID=29722 RepID=UPI0025843DB9|nr:protein ZINC INDUCED FACILITATOR-LIKE 1-like [Amaranthus tricolor]